MADFTTSSHRACWFFTAKELDNKHLTANQRALQTLYECVELTGESLCIVEVLEEIGLEKKRGCTAIEALADGGVMYHAALTNECKKGTKKKAALPEPLTVNDELLMRVFYEKKVFELCQALKLPPKIKEAAIIYFKRFYLLWSVMEHHPKFITVTSVYIACKTSEVYISAEQICNIFKLNEEDILWNEMLICKSLNFDLMVYGPYRSIDALVSEIKGLEAPIKHNLEDEIEKLMLTDAPLIFPPGQLALAALKRVSGQIREFDFERYLHSLCSQLQNNHSYSEMVESLDAIEALMETAEISPSIEEMKPIDSKLRHCRRDKIKVSKHEKTRRHKPNPQTNVDQ